MKMVAQLKEVLKEIPSHQFGLREHKACGGLTLKNKPFVCMLVKGCDVYLNNTEPATNSGVSGVWYAHRWCLRPTTGASTFKITLRNARVITPSYASTVTFTIGGALARGGSLQTLALPKR